LSKRALFFACGALALAALFAGCGGSDDTSSSLSKAEFVKKGNAICTAGNKEIEEGFEAFAKEHDLSSKQPPSKAESKEAAETILLPAIKKQVEKIRALGPPDDEADEVLDSAEESIEKGEEDPVALIEEEAVPMFAATNKKARAYGLTVCGEEEG
jgi:hypothetical protein